MEKVASGSTERVCTMCGGSGQQGRAWLAIDQTGLRPCAYCGASGKLSGSQRHWAVREALWEDLNGYVCHLPIEDPDWERYTNNVIAAYEAIDEVGACQHAKEN